MDMAEELIRLYPWLTRIAKRYYKNEMDAEDLVGDTIYKMLANKHKFDMSKDLKPLLVTVMHNTYITAYNRRMLIQFCGEEDIMQCCSSATTYDRTLVHDIIKAIIRCNRRSKSVQSVVLYAKGYSYQEISIIMDLPVNTVRSRISYARQIIRKELGI